MRISDWSSDVCSSDLQIFSGLKQAFPHLLAREIEIGVVGKDRRNLAEAIARDRARRIEPGNAGKRDFDRISDQLLDFDRRKTRVNRIDMNLIRMEERRGGKECDRTGRYRWSRDYDRKKRKRDHKT